MGCALRVGFDAYICVFLLWVADRLLVSWLLLGVCYCVGVCWLLVLGWFFVVRFGWVLVGFAVWFSLIVRFL